ncbi:TonB-dependent receptor [Gayadomonas joobiniege]|uniref:TonB-dependent receptor n=1 Tax=Gayadomonas joobiniege TaxID=1234606 RepID=UPI00035DDFD5|nr:TonB-dependent receptor [Gayadomonas joobiniege]
MQTSMNIKPTLLAVSVLAAINSAYAQETEQTQVQQNKVAVEASVNKQADTKTQTQDVETIEVTGLRSSLLKATELKRTANNVIDVITAEDVGAFPDENVVESLQRVTGVQVIFGDNGSAGQFQVRGVAQNRIELNGRSVAGGEGSNPSRDVNLSDFPSELIDSLEVIKSPTADLTEGSLGATINLKTKRPLSVKNDFLNVTAKAKYADEADEIFPNINIVGSKSWRDTQAGSFGALLNLTYNDNHNGGDIVRTDSWTNVCPMYTLDASGRTILQQNLCGEGDLTVFRPNWFGLIDNNTQNTKTALAATVQWKPTDNASYTFDLVHNKTETMSYSDIMVLNSNTNWILPASELNDDGKLYGFTNVETGSEIVRTDNMGRFVDTVIPATYYTTATGNVNNVNAQAFPSETTQTTFALKGEWNFERLGIEAEAAHSRSDHERHYVVARLNAYYGNPINQQDQRLRIDDPSIMGTDQATAIRQTGSDLTVDLSDPRTIGLSLDTSSMDPNDMRYWRVNSFANDGWKRSPVSSAAKIDFTYDLDQGIFTTLKFGARLAQDEMENTTRFRFSCAGNWNWGANGAATNSYNELTDYNCEKPMSGVEFANLYPDLIKTHDGFYSEAGSVPSFSAIDLAVFKDNRELWNELSGFNELGGYSESPGENYVLTEDTSALYAMTNIDGDLTSNITYRGNFGVRAVNTKVKAETYTSVDDAGNPQALVSSNDYNNILPSMNIAFAHDEYGLVRFAAAKVMVRPALDKLLPVAQLNNYNGCSVYDRLDPNFGIGLNTENYPNSVLSQEEQLKQLAQDYALSNGLYSGIVDTCPGIRNGWTNIGNINLVAQTSTNMDISFERYWGKGNMVSLAFFHRKVEADLVTRKGILAVPAEPGTNLVGVEGNGGASGQDILVGQDISSQPGYELWSVRTAFNGQGSVRQGIEIGYTQWLDFLPDFWNGFGFSANYTYSDGTKPDPVFIDKVTEVPLDLAALGISAGGFEAQRDALDALVAAGELDAFDLQDRTSILPIENMSKHSGNFSVFYDKGKFNARLAANYRSSYYKSGEANNPLYSDSSTRADFSANYKVNKKLKFDFSINNLTKTKLHHYRIDQQITDRSSYSDRIYTVGVNYKFN